MDYQPQRSANYVHLGAEHRRSLWMVGECDVQVGMPGRFRNLERGPAGLDAGPRSWQ
jgi:hypothetical protein